MGTSMKNFTLVLVSFFSLIFGAVGGGVSSYLILIQQEPGDTVINFENGSYESVWEAAAPAVVSVVALKDLFQNGGELSQVSSGTGFIITADGLVVTNKHVVSDTEAQYVVILDDGTQLDAEVL